MTWEKGKSGNPGGRDGKKLIRRAFMNCLSVSEAEKIAQPIIAKAQKGDLEAATFIRDTCDGKPKQEIDINDERSSNLAERFEEILLSAARTADAVHPARGEGGIGRVN